MMIKNRTAKMLLTGTLVMLMVFSATSCGNRDSSSSVSNEESSLSEYVGESNTSYETNPENGTDSASDDYECYAPNTHTTENNNYYNYENNYDYDSYEFDSVDESTSFDSDSDEASPADPDQDDSLNEDVSYEDSSYSEDSATEESFSIDPNHDYAEEASIRTNEVCFDVKNPKVGATEAVIRTEFTNYSGSKISMAGCTVYNYKGEVIGSNYSSCDYTEETGFIEFDLNEDMGLVLERGESYFYNFVVESNGELFTHKQMFFKTNNVDDKFAFELQDAELSEDNDTVTISAKVFNPTGLRVTSVGQYTTSAPGAHVSDETIQIDTTDTEFIVTFEISGFKDDTFFGPDFDYTVTVNYEGEKYTSYMGHFSVPK